MYVLARRIAGAGCGLALVREMIEGEREDGRTAARAARRTAPSRGSVRWLLHTADAQGLYAKLGFTTAPPPYPLMERTRERACETLERTRRGGRTRWPAELTARSRADRGAKHRRRERSLLRSMTDHRTRP